MRRAGAALLVAAALAGGCEGAGAKAPVYGVEIVAAFPHDAGAFTQGLFYRDGFLYESTGLYGKSSLRKVDIATGRVVKIEELPDAVFGEGIAPFAGKIVGLTWRSETGFVFDLETFGREREFSYEGEGWGLTEDGARLIMSDGTASLRFLDPQSLKETGRVTVIHDGAPLASLNELEWVEGEIFANIWLTNAIARIDPDSGEVVGLIDLRALRAEMGGAGAGDVLNGIAYDAKDKRLFVTGKNWPKLFEIRIVPKAE